jgi:lipid II:glycine glycyltransferase (peptidoglycan interpeptide bridge formation enzyme)
MVAHIRELARKNGASFIRISPQIAPTAENESFLRSLGFRPAAIHAMDAEVCRVLDIGQPVETLLSGMRKTTRYEIRRAEKLGLVVRASTDRSDVDAFLRLYGDTAKRRGFVAHPGIREEFDVFGNDGRAIIVSGLYEGKLLAGALILFHADQAIYHHGASLPTRIPASYLVQWRAIQEAKKRGLKLYNFWGIAPENNPNHPWSGLSLFKKGFGGRTVSYLHAHDYVISSGYAVLRIIETAEKTFRGY